MFLAAPASQGGGMQMMIMIVIMFAIMYFLMIRPQQKKQKQHQSMLGALEKGDEIMTTGGIIGRVVKVQEQFIVVAISDTVEIKFQKASISQTLPKGTIKDIES